MAARETRVYLVRHGATRSNRENIYAGWSREGLEPDSAQKAERLGVELSGWGIEALYSSPVRRAVETARILNGHLDGVLFIEPDLREMKMGPWEGLSVRDVAQRYPAQYRTWLERPSELSIEGRETLQRASVKGDEGHGKDCRDARRRRRTGRDIRGHHKVPLSVLQQPAA